MLRQPTSLSKGCLSNFPVVLVTRTFRIPPYSHSHTSIPIVFPARVCCMRRKPIPRFSTIDGRSSPDNELSSDASFASTGGKEDHHEQKNSTTEILTRLKKYGMSGVLSYGLLNTAYYLPTFLFVWLYVAPAPGKMGYVAAVERFLKTFAMVWAGSQVTKIARAAGALALAPVVDTGLSWFTVKFNFESQGKAFTAIVGFCFGLAFFMFLLLTLLWA